MPPSLLNEMTFKVSDDCYALGLRAGAVVFRGVRIEQTSESLRREIDAEIAHIQKSYPDPKQIRGLDEVAALHTIFRSVGVNPKRMQPSNQRLLELASKRGILPSVNSLVDTYNLISIRTGCSMGAHDMDRLALPVSLTMTTGEESFIPLGESEPVYVPAGEFAYVDAANRMVCRMDVRQAEFSKVTVQSRNVLLIIEANAGISDDVIHRTFDESIDRITDHCGGEAETVWFPAL